MEAKELTSVSDSSISGIEILFSDLPTASFVTPTQQEAPKMREVIGIFKDDLDGSEATHHDVRFSFEGVEYSTDLSEENYTNLKYSIEKYADHATRVSGGRGRPRSSSASSPVSAGSSKEKKDELAAIRAWCEVNKIEISARGHIRESIIHAFKENDPSLVGG